MRGPSACCLPGDGDSSRCPPLHSLCTTGRLSLYRVPAECSLLHRTFQPGYEPDDSGFKVESAIIDKQTSFAANGSVARNERAATLDERNMSSRCARCGYLRARLLWKWRCHDEECGLVRACDDKACQRYPDEAPCGVEGSHMDAAALCGDFQHRRLIWTYVSEHI